MTLAQECIIASSCTRALGDLLVVVRKFFNPLVSCCGLGSGGHAGSRALSAVLDPLLVLYFLAAACSIAVRNARVYCRFFSRIASKRSIADAVWVLILCSISVRMHWQWTSWCIWVRMRRCHALVKSSVAPSHAHLSSKFDAMTDECSERWSLICHGRALLPRGIARLGMPAARKTMHMLPISLCDQSGGIPCFCSRMELPSCDDGVSIIRATTDNVFCIVHVGCTRIFTNRHNHLPPTGLKCAPSHGALTSSST